MDETVEEVWARNIEKQDVKNILGDRVETKNFVGGEFPQVQVNFPYAIKVLAKGEDAFFAALFFEQVLTVLTDDAFLDFYNYEELLFWEKKDYECTAVLPQSNHPKIDATGEKNILSLVELLHEREKEIVKQMGEDRQNAGSLTMQLRKALNEIIVDEKIIKAKKEELQRVTDKLEQRESTMISTSLKAFHDKLFTVQLKGAIRRIGDKDTSNCVSPEGIDNYGALRDALTQAFTESNCFYLMCIYMLKHTKKLFAKKIDGYWSSDDKNISDLELKCKRAVLELPSEEYQRVYGPMISVQHKDEYYILINKSVAETLPFVCGSTREKLGHSAIRQQLLDRTQRILTEKNYTQPGMDRFSTEQKRMNEIIYHSVFDAINTFEIAIRVNARHAMYGPGSYSKLKKHETWAAFPIKYYSLCLQGIFNPKTKREKAETGTNVFYAFSSLERRATLHENDVLDIFLRYFYEGSPSKETYKLPLKLAKKEEDDKAREGTVYKKFEIVSLMQDIKNSSTEISGKMHVNVGYQGRFYECLKNEIFFIGDVLKNKKIKYIQNWKDIEKTLVGKLDYGLILWKGVIAPQIEKYHTLFFENYVDKEVLATLRPIINAYMLDQTMEMNAIKTTIEEVIKSLEADGVKSDFVEQSKNIVFEYQEPKKKTQKDIIVASSNPNSVKKIVCVAAFLCVLFLIVAILNMVINV